MSGVAEHAQCGVGLHQELTFLYVVRQNQLRIDGGDVQE